MSARVRTAILVAAIPVGVGLALGERPGAIAGVGVVLALVAVVLERLRARKTPAELQKIRIASEGVIDSMLAVLEAMRGRIASAREHYRRSHLAFDELGLNVQLAAFRMYAGWAELIAGDSTAAERELRVGYEALERMGGACVATAAADAASPTTRATRTARSGSRRVCSPAPTSAGRAWSCGCGPITTRSAAARA